MSTEATRRLRRLEEHLNRVAPRKPELYYLNVDPALYGRAKELMEAAATPATASDSEEAKEAK